MFKFQWFNCINSNRNVASINVKLQLMEISPQNKERKLLDFSGNVRNFEGNVIFFRLLLHRRKKNLNGLQNIKPTLKDNDQNFL